ncbi:MAG: DUF1223 domain-containing protein [Rickettsiales bacterium]|nr:DUF1223 domain-containing protein [Rickettsiales bacterium]
MKIFSAFIGIMSAYSAVTAHAQTTPASHPAVLELFTSQGCSSCPPADKIVSSYADNAGVLVLSYHVNYWDYLGWKDPYSSAENTERQREYAAYLRARNVYTPQVIIQGKYDVVGSNRAALQSALVKATKQPQWHEPHLTRDNGGLKIQLSEAQGIDAILLVVGFQKHSTNGVARGENAGEQLSHRNSVTSTTSLGVWNGKPLTKSFALPKGDGAAILIQSRETGEIIGAGWL